MYCSGVRHDLRYPELLRHSFHSFVGSDKFVCSPSELDWSVEDSTDNAMTDSMEMQEYFLTWQ